eukprot:g3916.t1
MREKPFGTLSFFEGFLSIRRREKCDRVENSNIEWKWNKFYCRLVKYLDDDTRMPYCKWFLEGSSPGTSECHIISLFSTVHNAMEESGSFGYDMYCFRIVPEPGLDSILCSAVDDSEQEKWIQAFRQAIIDATSQVEFRFCRNKKLLENDCSNERKNEICTANEFSLSLDFDDIYSTHFEGKVGGGSQNAFLSSAEDFVILESVLSKWSTESNSNLTFSWQPSCVTLTNLSLKYKIVPLSCQQQDPKILKYDLQELSKLPHQKRGVSPLSYYDAPDCASYNYPMNPQITTTHCKQHEEDLPWLNCRAVDVTSIVDVQICENVSSTKSEKCIFYVEIRVNEEKEENYCYNKQNKSEQRTFNSGLKWNPSDPKVERLYFLAPNVRCALLWKKYIEQMMSISLCETESETETKRDNDVGNTKNDLLPNLRLDVSKFGDEICSGWLVLREKMKSEEKILEEGNKKRLVDEESQNKSNSFHEMTKHANKIANVAIAESRRNAVSSSLLNTATGQLLGEKLLDDLKNDFQWKKRFFRLYRPWSIVKCLESCKRKKNNSNFSKNDKIGFLVWFEHLCKDKEDEVPLPLGAVLIHSTTKITTAIAGGKPFGFVIASTNRLKTDIHNNDIRYVSFVYVHAKSEKERQYWMRQIRHTSEMVELPDWMIQWESLLWNEQMNEALQYFDAEGKWKVNGNGAIVGRLTKEEVDEVGRKLEEEVSQMVQKVHKIAIICKSRRAPRWNILYCHLIVSCSIAFQRFSIFFQSNRRENRLTKMKNHDFAIAIRCLHRIVQACDFATSGTPLLAQNNCASLSPKGFHSFEIEEEKEECKYDLTLYLAKFRKEIQFCQEMYAKTTHLHFVDVATQLAEVISQSDHRVGSLTEVVGGISKVVGLGVEESKISTFQESIRTSSTLREKKKSSVLRIIGNLPPTSSKNSKSGKLLLETTMKNALIGTIAPSKLINTIRDAIVPTRDLYMQFDVKEKLLQSSLRAFSIYLETSIKLLEIRYDRESLLHPELGPTQRRSHLWIAYLNDVALIRNAIEEELRVLALNHLFVESDDFSDFAEKKICTFISNIEGIHWQEYIKAELKQCDVTSQYLYGWIVDDIMNHPSLTMKVLFENDTFWEKPLQEGRMEKICHLFFAHVKNVVSRLKDGERTLLYAIREISFMYLRRLLWGGGARSTNLNLKKISKEFKLLWNPAPRIMLERSEIVDTESVFISILRELGSIKSAFTDAVHHLVAVYSLHNKVPDETLPENIVSDLIKELCRVNVEKGKIDEFLDKFRISNDRKKLININSLLAAIPDKTEELNRFQYDFFAEGEQYSKYPSPRSLESDIKSLQRIANSITLQTERCYLKQSREKIAEEFCIIDLVFHFISFSLKSDEKEEFLKLLDRVNFGSRDNVSAVFDLCWKLRSNDDKEDEILTKQFLVKEIEKRKFDPRKKENLFSLLACPEPERKSFRYKSWARRLRVNREKNIQLDLQRRKASMFQASKGSGLLKTLHATVTQESQCMYTISVTFLKDVWYVERSYQEFLKLHYNLKEVAIATSTQLPTIPNPPNFIQRIMRKQHNSMANYFQAVLNFEIYTGLRAFTEFLDVYTEQLSCHIVDFTSVNPTFSKYKLRCSFKRQVYFLEKSFNDFETFHNDLQYSHKSQIAPECLPHFQTHPPDKVGFIEEFIQIIVKEWQGTHVVMSFFNAK